jgi:hypothetical protein
VTARPWRWNILEASKDASEDADLIGGLIRTDTP